MKRNFYFFRHGQTNENAAGAIEATGIDAYLTKEGVQQAEELASFLKNKNIDIIYSSPLQRAIKTAEIVIKYHPDIPIITENDLIETAFGFWYNENPDAQSRINNNFNRIKSCLDKIIAESLNKDIAISSHGGVTRALCYAAGLKVGNIKIANVFILFLMMILGNS